MVPMVLLSTTLRAGEWGRGREEMRGGENEARSWTRSCIPCQTLPHQDCFRKACKALRKLCHCQDFLAEALLHQYHLLNPQRSLVSLVLSLEALPKPCWICDPHWDYLGKPHGVSWKLLVFVNTVEALCHQWVGSSWCHLIVALHAVPPAKMKCLTSVDLKGEILQPFLQTL